MSISPKSLDLRPFDAANWVGPRVALSPCAQALSSPWWKTTEGIGKISHPSRSNCELNALQEVFASQQHRMGTSAYLYCRISVPFAWSHTEALS